MKVTTPYVILVSLIIGGICIFGIIVCMTIMAVDHVEIPQGTAALFGAIVTAFLTGVFSVVSHTLGFANGTLNGENAAQATALRTVMGQDTSSHNVEDKL